jgi:hypothetical protein
MKAVPALAALVALMLPGAYALGGPINVYAGYLNNGSGPPNAADIPTPFDASATTILISTGGVDTSHDTGVLRFENTGTTSVSVSPGINVAVGATVFQLWDGDLPLTLNPGQNLVLAETGIQSFDVSESVGADNPVVSGSISGVSFSFADAGRILFGHEDAATSAETTPYGLLGTVQVGGGGGNGVTEPGSLALLGLGAMVLGGLARTRRS